MIHRLLSLVILISLVCISHVAAQEQASMRYAVVFYHQDNTYIATLSGDDKWRVTDLEMRVASPTWSSDGQTLYGVPIETVGFTMPSFGDGILVPYGRSVVAFKAPDWHIEKSIEVLPAENLQDQSQADVLNIQSLSPDGHYAWLTLQNKVHGPVLIDLVTGTPLHQSTCPAIALDWASTFVMTSNEPTTDPTCGPEVAAIDLTTGERHALGQISQFVMDGFYVPAAEVVVGETSFASLGIGVALYLIPLDGSTVEEIIPAIMPTASADGHYLTYLTPYTMYSDLKRLDLQTRQTEVIDQGYFFDLGWDGNVLAYVRLTETHDTSLVVSVEYHGAARTERTLYDGPRPHWSSPTDYYINELYDSNIPVGYVDIYRLGKLVWSSRHEYPRQTFSRLAWNDKPVYGRWLWLETSPSYVILDLETLAFLPQPGPEYLMNGITSDGSWLIGRPRLIDPLTTNSVESDVIAYSPITGELVTLVEGPPSPGGGYLGTPNSQYIWWPEN